MTNKNKQNKNKKLLPLDLGHIPWPDHAPGRMDVPVEEKQAK